MSALALRVHHPLELFFVCAGPFTALVLVRLRLYHEDRTPTHGYAATREAAMAAFAKSWRSDTAILFFFALHSLTGRILHLEPIGRPAASVGRILPLANKMGVRIGALYFAIIASVAGLLLVWLISANRTAWQVLLSGH
jgi:hypothetical protein